MKISKEIKVALLVISGILLFIYLFTYLKGEDIFTDEDNYYTEFDYNALSTSSPVTIKGNAVGKVEEITYDFETGKTRVSFSVNPKLKFSKNSTIRLYETGIMGGNALAIIKANDGEMAKRGDFIKSEVKPGLVSSLSENFSGLSSNLDSTLRSADTLMTNLNGLVIDESDEGLKATISELNSTLKSFKNLSYSLQKTIKANDEKIASVLDNVDKTAANMAVLTADLKEVDLGKTVANLDETLVSINSIMAGLKENKGTIGKLLNDDALYNNLESATKELELLLLDIKLHPARYRRILSKREIPYTPPTEEQKN
ncbi:MlaD family protein [Ichthyenterobacterium sp. W332]|uniref:MlaD family protein n=1 Tax=Microcosmobacter mediterraneus TaxID=3075607 RepID=A0ABU2YQ34_9FLAO|nr:MlaD family protein [Ichthyenterobacterium sp. W332]MDT0559168.1 MlaD family protein [Ichthyenterobacterium sp. W332]